MSEKIQDYVRTQHYSFINISQCNAVMMHIIDIAVRQVRCNVYKSLIYIFEWMSLI